MNKNENSNQIRVTFNSSSRNLVELLARLHKEGRGLKDDEYCVIYRILDEKDSSWGLTLCYSLENSLREEDYRLAS